MKIGEIMPLEREIVLNEGKETRTLLVANTGDRPVQVGSHFHFFEVNRCLSLTGRWHTAFIWIYLPALPCGLNPERRRRFP